MKLSGTRTTRSHRPGGTPPVGKSPSAGRSSGLHPCAGRKKASEVKLKLFSPEEDGTISAERCSVCLAETGHALGKFRSVSRGLDGSLSRAISAPSQSAWAEAR